MNNWTGRRGKGEEKLPIGPVLLAIGCVTASRGSGRYTVSCPFHNDRSPSATVDENEGWLHCFVCGYHEDAVGLVMMKYGSPFREAKKQAEEIISGVYTHNGLPKRNKRKTLLSKW